MCQAYQQDHRLTFIILVCHVTFQSQLELGEKLRSSETHVSSSECSHSVGVGTLKIIASKEGSSKIFQKQRDLMKS